jgi:gliding-associated putative ABC transporter substrate-binding component GldG
MKYDPDPAKFNKGGQLVGVLLEGNFPSCFENRVSAQMNAGLTQLGMSFKPVSEATRMIVVSDGDIAANFVRDYAQKQFYPLGFNRFEKTTYANKDFIINAIEYLIDPYGVIEARTKEVKLRLLDSVRARNEKPYWQALNIGLPLAFLGLFGWWFQWRRKRRYAA